MADFNKKFNPMSLAKAISGGPEMEMTSPPFFRIRRDFSSVFSS